MIVDVSHHNGIIDWKEVSKNIPKIEGAYIKSSEGSNGMDNRMASNVAGCIANNIKWGLYHFATWNLKPVDRDAEQEAKWFLCMVRSIGKMPDLPLILDIESNDPIPYTKDEMVKYVKTFTDIIKSAGYKIGIYGSPGFLNSYLPTNHPFKDMPLWVADYSGAINPVNGWSKPWLHQYTDKGTVRGISTTGKTDLNKLL